MAQVISGNTVKVHYTGTLDDGTEFDSSRGGEPLEFTVGGGGIIPGFENAIMGMAPGETKSVTIPVAEAYGAHDAGRVQEIDRGKVPAEVQLEVGGRVQAVASEGQTLDLMVVALSDATVTLDFNHPLAGQNLTFALELVEIV